MAYVVLRCEKVKINDVGRVVNHNLRKYESTEKTEHINFSKTKLNRISFGSSDVRKKMNEILEKRKDSKKVIRKDAVVMMEFIVSASSEFFYTDLDKKNFNNLTMKENQAELENIFLTMDSDRLKEFEKVVIEWFKKEFGEENIVNINLHLDEKTPHFHCLVVPMTKDKRLSCKEIYTRENARNWQTTFAESCSHLGLQRGKEFSGDVHTSQYTFNKGLLENNRIKPPVSEFKKFDNEEYIILSDKQKINYLLLERKEIDKQRKFYKSFYECYKDNISELNILREENNKLVILNSKKKRSKALNDGLKEEFTPIKKTSLKNWL